MLLFHSLKASCHLSSKAFLRSRIISSGVIGKMSCSSWNYVDQESWCHLPNSQSNGLNQSPIDIPTKDTKESPEISPLILKGYEQKLKGTWTRTSHSLRFDPSGPAPSIVTYGGAYILRQFHFHWGDQPGCGSEHLVDGSSYDAELHFVHEKESPTSNVPNAPDQFAVLGVLLKRSKGQGGGEVWEALKNVPQVDKKIEIEVTPSQLLPANKSYWHYGGSLTTPPCSEVVQWFVFHQILSVPDDVVQRWSTLPSESPLPFNYRKVQELNGRKVWLLKDSN
ncbi:PREDICTED: carbonic anhydrase 1 [Amphimedon queenslandica]|uniref:Carbonic anhydrase n=1 Tax=Amphimedon queenslandica TaxID=400682 RepID=A6QR76_AMPQE|nr:PREDICTED: carbonic anhydrase 1 [Amphimedon queenslandica]DAA06051.1 TPA_inf: carbonic anhydrase 2 [Amphimedon queenslandica]|eukprot:XP_003383417.1 PREDICTED: carbonic anhydrase 1 [Amphimedon queenslandica]